MFQTIIFGIIFVNKKKRSQKRQNQQLHSSGGLLRSKLTPRGSFALWAAKNANVAVVCNQALAQTKFFKQILGGKLW